MTTAPDTTEPWMPNGFPPPSFVVETAQRSTFAGTPGRWLAAAGILGALLLITGIALIAQDDDTTNIATRSTTTTTLFGDTNLVFPGDSMLDPTATVPEATTIPGGGTVPVNPSAPVPPGVPGGAGGTTTTAAPGIIVAEPSTLNLPTIDPTDPARARQGATLTLRNTGGSDLSFSTQSGYGGLTASPSTGTIPPGGSLPVDIVMDGTDAPEANPASAQLMFSGTANSTVVTVNAIVRRQPPNLEDGGDDKSDCLTRGITDGCSSQIVRTSGQSACDFPWRIRVVATDASGVASVTAQLSGGSTNVVTLTKEADGRTWSGDPRLPKGTGVRFKVTATDSSGAAATGAEQAVTCQ